MLGHPPRPTPVLPDNLNLNEWVAQIKFRGWRVIIHKNEAFTRKGNPLNIHVSYPLKDFDYQLDGEIINPERLTEHGVRTATMYSFYVYELE